MRKHDLEIQPTLFQNSVKDKSHTSAKIEYPYLTLFPADLK